MWNIIKEYRHYVLAVILGIIPLIALNAGNKKPSDLYFFDRVAIQLTAPVQAAMSWCIGSSWDLFQDYLLLYDVQKDNLQLAQTNRKLMNEIAAYREMVLENERLHKLVKFATETPGRKTMARVIAQDIMPDFEAIRINKGSDHGIKRGMAAITHEGIVGRIIRVSQGYSDILTLLDSRSAVDALIQRNRSRGVVEGTSRSALDMKYLRRTDDIRVGDVVISSGTGGLFPKGLVIGKVVNVEKKNWGITQQVDVYPNVDFSKLEEVIVIKPSQILEIQ